MPDTAPPPAANPLPDVSALRRPVWVFDFRSWRIVAANPAAVRLWGRDSLAELQAHDFSETSPAVRDRLDGYRRRLEAGESVEEDWTFYPPSGPVTVRCLCSPTQLPDGRTGLLAEAVQTGRGVSEGITRSLEAMRHAGAAIAMLDDGGQVSVANPMADMLLGLREGTIIDPQALFADPRRGREALGWAWGGAVFDEEAVLRTALGERWCAVRIHPAVDPGSGASALVISASDVHRRHTVERRLSESERARAHSERDARDLATAQRRAAQAERTLRDAIDSMTEGFLLVGRDDRILMANRRYAEMYPTLADWLVPGVAFADMIRVFAEAEGLAEPDGLDAWVAERTRLMRAEPTRAWEQKLRDGRVFLVNERTTGNGNVVSLRTDITHLKRIEAELRERVQAIEAASDGIAITDRAGRFIFMNAAHAALFGGRPEDFAGQSWEILYEAEQRARFRDTILPAVAETGSWRGESVACRRDGTSVEQEISLSRLETGGLLCVTRDIGARKEAEAERARLQQQLFQAQKMDSLGRLAGGIAHDFNNILASMLGYAHFLVEDLPEDSEEQRYARNLVGAGSRAQDLVAQILAFGRPAERDRETLDLGSVISETLQMLHSTLPPEVVAAAEIDPKAPAVMGDRTQLTQIVMNLAVNARDAIGAGPGRIALSVAPPGPETWPARSDAGPGLRLETGADGTARLWTGQLPTGPLVAVTVSDSGCGMPSDVLQSIFEPFFTTKRRGEGTGLGLAAVHGLVSGHGGAIAVATRPGAGTAFTVVLPAAPAAAPELPPAHAAGVEAAPVQVLVVDDEDGIRGMLATALRRRGFTALTAADAASALETLERERVDAVISDQHMPGMSGLDLLKRVRANRPDLPFVLCTGFSDTLDSATATAAGANAFLQKPVAAQQLIAVLADALRRS